MVLVRTLMLRDTSEVRALVESWVENDREVTAKAENRGLQELAMLAATRE